ncbi:kinesin light chain 1 and [Aspergillus flavus]|nr:kinesin light chain 1 and [Aspergillus flavus]
MENSAPVMQEIQATEPVFELAVECESLYAKQINSFNDAGNENAAKILSDLYQRFSSWAAFLGVFAESNVCLDRRLRRHADIQDQVLRLLDIMRRNIICLSKDGDQTLVGAGPLVENVGKSQPVSVHMQSLNAISAALERLNQLGTAIRRTSMVKHVSKARELSETFGLTSFEQVTYMSLRTLYPDCSESLIEQLSRSMIETYALFLHRKSRKARLGVNRSLPRECQSVQMVPEEPSSGIDGPGRSDIDPGLANKSDYSKAGLAQPVPVRPIQRLYGVPQTQPTSVDIQELKAHLKRQSNPSIGSKPMSILVNNVGYPRANKESLVCEWCFGPLTPDILEGLKWQQHVNEDFKPYVCVSEKCLQPLMRFSSSAEWLQHMTIEHGSNWHRDVHAPSSWICPLCTEEDATFHSPDRLSNHLDTHHDSIFRENQVKAIVRQSKFPTARPLFECPLCCLFITEEQHTESGKPSTRDKGPGKKDYLPKPGGGGPKRIRIDTRSMASRGTSANETIIATHVIAHLQNIMLLNLRLMSIEGPIDGPAGSQSAATDTDYQVSKDPSVGGTASDQSRTISAVDPETAQIPLVFNDEELHGRALGFSEIEREEQNSKACENDSEVDITWDLVPIMSYDRENDFTIKKMIAASRAAETSETFVSSDGSLADPKNDLSKADEHDAKALLSAIPIYCHKKESHKLRESVWMVPFTKNPQFVDREEITRIEGLITQQNGPGKVAICGLGGIGKTQIALELAYRMRDRDPGYSIFWITCTSYESVEQAYISIALKLGMTNIKPAEVKEKVKAYLSQESAGKWFLIFDKADNMEMWSEDNTNSPVLMDFLPQCEQGHILFITRSRKVAVKLASSYVITISEPDTENAVKILENALSEKTLLNNRDTAITLLKQLTFLPLAIIQAAAFINKNCIGLTEYIILLQDQEPDVIELLSEDFENNGRYEDTQNPVAITWFISFQQIQRVNELAAEYLLFMACINPRNIPQSLLPQPNSIKNRIDAINLLKAFFFVTEGRDGSLNLHRLVHLATRNWIRKNQQFSRQILKTANRLNEAFANNGHTNRKVWREYLPHAFSLIAETEFQKEQEKYINFIANIGRCLYSDGRWKEAEELQLRVTELSKQVLGLEHPDTLTSMANLVLTYWNLGQWKEAEQLEIQVMELRKQVLGPEHPETLTSMHNLASIFRDQGQWKEAEELQLRVMELRKQVLGPEHPETLTSMHNLAYTWKILGKV